MKTQMCKINILLKIFVARFILSLLILKGDTSDEELLNYQRKKCGL